jgi:hypothetical protein
LGTDGLQFPALSIFNLIVWLIYDARAAEFLCKYRMTITDVPRLSPASAFGDAIVIPVRIVQVDLI